MKHLKSFNESHTQDWYNTLMKDVTSGNEGSYTDDDAQRQAWEYVLDIEKATGEKVIEISGVANEGDVQLEIVLDDNQSSTITIEYEMISYNSEKFTVHYDGDSRSNNEQEFRDLAKEKNEDYYEHEVYYMLKSMLPSKYTHSIVINGEDEGEAKWGDGVEDELLFTSEEEAKKWIESLTIKILKFEVSS